MGVDFRSVKKPSFPYLAALLLISSVVLTAISVSQPDPFEDGFCNCQNNTITGVFGDLKFSYLTDCTLFPSNIFDCYNYDQVIYLRDPIETVAINNVILLSMASSHFMAGLLGVAIRCLNSNTDGNIDNC